MGRHSLKVMSPLSSRSDSGPEGAGPTANAVLVREQLKRLLAHPLFTNSKRYPVLLAYTVEQALLGNASELKERTIGVEAFGREPNYDVNLDPVVRTTAAEVRKRLIQYYYNPDHAGELVIEMPVGSYVPSFREPAPPQAPLAVEPPPAQETETSRPESERAAARPVARRGILIAGALLGVGLIGFGAGRIRFPKPPSNLERFWEPITASPNRVTYCLGEPGLAIDGVRPPQEGPLLTANLHVSDVVTLARSIVPLVPRNGAFRVLAASDTGFSQLREAPFVLIGAFDNPWTLRITQDLPFGFVVDSRGRRVVGRRNAKGKAWTLKWHIPNLRLARDYAVVARIHDNVTGQPVIILGGILGYGTEAASEVVSNPEYLNAMLEKAPANWAQRNLAAVIETNVIDGHAGPPSVVAVESW